MTTQALIQDGESFCDAQRDSTLPVRKAVDAASVKNKLPRRVVQSTFDLDESEIEAVMRSVMEPGHEHLNAELDERS
jgi:hypothetical protein